MRVPGLLEWPAKITTPRVVNIPCSTEDYYPTILDILGLEMKQQPQPLDGASLVPLLNGTMTARPRPIGFQSGKQVAMTDNRYKLVRANKSKARELYDVVADPGESYDLAARKPAIVEAMARTLDDWIQACKQSAAGGDYGDGHANQR